METGAREEVTPQIESRTKNLFRTLSAFGGGSATDTVIEISDEGGHGIRRSNSMNHWRACMADTLEFNQVEDCQMKECQLHGFVGSPKGSLGEARKCDSSGSSGGKCCIVL
ncbi:hypothetical protein Ancab_033020 [Ancistrocladus abbreviatus]